MKTEYFLPTCVSINKYNTGVYCYFITGELVSTKNRIFLFNSLIIFTNNYGFLIYRLTAVLDYR